MIDPTKILWIPVDIPKFPRPDLLLEPDVKWNYWHYLKFTNWEKVSDAKQSYKNSYQLNDFKNEFRTKFPEIVEWFNHLPIKTIRNIKYNLQVGRVPSHIDFEYPDFEPELYKNNLYNEPCGYRVIIRGQRSNVLYVECNGKKTYTTLPESTDVYLLRQTDGIHGVEEDYHRATIFSHLEIDPEKHKKILKRSIEKYSEFAVLRQD
jgi:hypothetical protein